MKKTILKLSKIITSRALYLFIGIFISVAVLVAQADWYDDSPTDIPPGVHVSNGDALTPALWNQLKDKVRDLQISEGCRRRRSPSYTNDSVHYCPATYPLLFSCNIIDNNAPVVGAGGATDLASYCNSNMACDSSGAAPAAFRRPDLGGDGAFLETVINSAGIEGCWQYDNGHSRQAYKLELLCCRE